MAGSAGGSTGGVRAITGTGATDPMFSAMNREYTQISSTSANARSQRRGMVSVSQPQIPMRGP